MEFTKCGKIGMERIGCRVGQHRRDYMGSCRWRMSMQQIANVEIDWSKNMTLMFNMIGSMS